MSLVLIGILLISFNNISFAQIPNFGSAANFAFFSCSGAIGNTGVSNVTGDIGTDAGAISNFGSPSLLNGNSYSANNITAQASADLMSAYTQLKNFTITDSSHQQALGYNEVLTPGVYSIAGAASISGVLNLNGLGDSSKIFIFKINGAFATAAASSIKLLNGATACNVFWVVEGAAAIAATSNMAGTIIAHGSAASMGAGSSLQGRMFSTMGAIAVNNVNVTIATGCTVAPSNCNSNPVITVQPLSTKICLGQPYTFSVTAIGNNLNYQWRKDGISITGATASNYHIAATTTADAGLYDVLIVGSCSPFTASNIDTLAIGNPGINLASTASFVVFTSGGAVSNTGTSMLTGNIGTNAGAITGFETSTINGSVHNADSAAIQCGKDLQNLYNQLNTTSATNSTHAAVFGNGEILTPGVYSVTGAGSVAGTLILDAGGDASKIFMFKIGGAFTTAAATTVKLINNASPCNIFWVAEGAIAMAAGTIMKGTLIANKAAASMAAGGQLEGRLFSTFGAVSFNTLNAVIPTGCMQGTRWTGSVNSDWFSTCNWYAGLIPDDTSNVTIPSGLINYPVIGFGRAYVANLSIQNNASLTVTNATLVIKGNILNKGSFNAIAGTIDMESVSDQTIAENTFVNNTLQAIVIGTNVSLGGPLGISKAVSFSASRKTFNTNNYLTIKSNAAGTASIADLTNGGSLKGNTVLGNITTELFITKKRAWRLLSGQICTPGSLTINQAWQEGSNSANPAPGYGTQITGGTLANGFDQGINKNASIKVYNNSTNTFSALPAFPGTNTPITNYPGYFLFTRGDRSTDLSMGVRAPVTTTTLRVTGPANMGDVKQSVFSNNYTLVGNPYLESINFSTLTRKNVANKFYLWDPKMDGLSGVGGFVTFIWNEGTSVYDATSSISPVSQYIPYGEAFFVESGIGNEASSITFKETDKTALGSDNVFKPFINTSSLRVDLMEVNADSSSNLMDGVLTTYAINNNNAVDINDARKLYNVSENICLQRSGINLAIERRQTVISLDTSFLKIYNLKKKLYKLLIKATALASDGLTATIKDRYLETNNNILINKDGVTEIYFTVNIDSGSFSANRFSIIFKKTPKPLLHFTMLSATQHEQNILIKWRTENEINIKTYEVQESTSGTIFTNKFSENFSSNNKAGTYGWLDIDATAGMHYYRIKSINERNEETYSSIVEVKIDKSQTPKIIVIGNPLQSNNIKLQFNNVDKGLYKLNLFTVEGKLMKQFSIDYSGGTSIQNFAVESYFPQGKYELQLSNKTLNFITKLAKK